MKFYSVNKFLAFLLMLKICSLLAIAQTSDTYNSQLTAVDKQLTEFKQNASHDKLQANRMVISDIENRKNNLRMLLKTAPAERNDQWKERWDKEMKQIETRLDKLK